MAPKRSTPIEDPPSASSSEEDPSEEEEQPPKKAAASTSVTPPTPAVHNKPETKLHSFSDDDSGSGSDSDSDSDHPLPIVADLSVKPISSKPMNDLANVKKLRSKPKASAKRPVDSGADAKDSKRAKSKGVEVEGGGSKPPVNDSKKAVIERIFQPADEVSLLSGMLDYSAKNGTDPFIDIDGFYLYIKKVVHVNFNKVQLLNKIKRLKKKYKNNERRKGKNGAGRTFSKAVEQETYYLSKNIWGEEGVNLGGGVKVVDHAKSNEKAKKTSQAEKDELLASIPAPKVEELEKPEALNSGPSHASSDSIFINKSLVSLGLDENFLKQGMGLIDGAKKLELEEKWRKLQIDEAELFLRRIVLVRELTELVLDAYKK